MKEITLKEVIKKRQHKYDSDLMYSCSKEYERYIFGWYYAYQDLLEILEQNKFDTEQVVIKGN